MDTGQVNQSLIEQARSDPALHERLAGLSNADLLALQYEWAAWARPDQQPPEWDWDAWLILAGRGFGKTRVGAETVRAWIKQGFNLVNLIAATADDLRDVLVEGESGILAVCPPVERPLYRSSKRRLEWPNGAISLLFTAQEPDRLRGKQHQKLWADELAAWQYDEDSWDMAQFGLRLGKKPQAVITTTPRPTKLIRELSKDQNVAVTRGTTYDNRSNLAPKFYRSIIKKYEGTRLGRQELLAEVLDDNPGALWQRSWIDETRVKSLPPLTRIVVAIDPAVTSSEDSDETGIIVAGMDGRDPAHFYVVADASLIATPDEWAKVAVQLYFTHMADRIIGEANNGGDLIEAVIRHQNADVAYRKVTASRGKAIRAEPASALYEQRRVHHLGMFAGLEDQLVEWNPQAGDKSPDRLDALVWALTELSGGAEGFAQYVKAEAKGMSAAGIIPELPGARILVDGRSRDRCECGSVAWLTIAGKQQCFKCGLPRPE